MMYQDIAESVSDEYGLRVPLSAYDVRAVLRPHVRGFWCRSLANRYGDGLAASLESAILQLADET